MSVSSVSSATSSYVPKPKASTSSKPDALATAVQEATETRSTTLKEAQAGDQVAIRKLQLAKQATQAQTPQQSQTDSSKGVDQHA